MRSFLVIARRKSSSSSERLISQGERLAAMLGSMSTLSGGRDREDRSDSATPDRDLRCGLVVEIPGDTPSRVDAVGDVAARDEHISQGNRDNLGGRGALLEKLREICRVDGVQVRIDLVEEVERMRLDALHRDDEGHTRDGLLPSAQGERFPCRFEPELGHKEDPTREDLLLILELEPSLSVCEPLEDEAELLSYLGEGGHEDTLLLRLDALDEADDRVPLLLQFVVSHGETLVVLVHLSVLLLGPPVHGGDDRLVFFLELGEEGFARVERLKEAVVAEDAEATERLLYLLLRGGDRRPE